MRLNRVIVGIISLTIALYSCHKVEPYNATNTTTDNTQYSFAGLNNSVATTTADVLVLDMLVDNKIGAEEKVTLSISDVPESMSAVFQPADGIAPLPTTLTLMTRFTPPGQYKVKVGVLAEGRTREDKLVTINVEPKEELDCNEFFYKAANNTKVPIQTITGQGTSVIKDNTKVRINDQFNDLYLVNVITQYDASGIKHFVTDGNAGQYMYFTVDCVKGTINVPLQFVGARSGSSTRSFQISGSGTIDMADNIYEINYTSDGVPYKLKGQFIPY